MPQSLRGKKVFQMSNLKILQYPDKGLREVAPPVTIFDDTLRQTIKQMFDKMYADDGAGLAATQVGLLLRLFVMDVSIQRNEAQCLINPEILAKEELIECEEGCLSLPGIYVKVTRAKKIHVQYYDEFGNVQTLTAVGLKANCIQHELDHLNGILSIDYLSNLKRMRVLKKMEKLQRVAQ